MSGSVAGGEASAAGKLPCRGRGAPHDESNLVEGHSEEVVQHERQALGGIQRVNPVNEIASYPVFWTILCRKTLVLPLLKHRYRRKSEDSNDTKSSQNYDKKRSHLQD